MNWRILSAGLAGGMAEVLLMALYDAIGMASAGEVAREVTASFAQGAGERPGAALLGLAIHLALSVMVAYAFVTSFGRFISRPRSVVVALGIAALAALWAVNFLVVLPVVNPRFTTLVPFAATLFSKALFGLVMGAVLARPAAPRSLAYIR